MTAELFTPPSRALDANADPYAGALLYSYLTGGLTPQAVYTTSALNVAHSNPVVADSSGKFANIYFDATLSYRVIIKNASGSVTLHDIDPVNTGLFGALAASGGAALVGFLQSGTGAVPRTIQNKLRDRVSVLDFGADPTGVTEATTAFQNAKTAAGAGEVFIPNGTYLIGNVGGLDTAGSQWVGESKYGAVLKVKSGTTGAIFSNTLSASGSSAYCGVRGIRFDYNGQNVTAVDLASVNNSIVEDCQFAGTLISKTGDTTNASAIITGLGSTSDLILGMKVIGAGIFSEASIASIDSSIQVTLTAAASATASGVALKFVRGVGVQFNAPLSEAAYNNVVNRCSMEYLATGVAWGPGANVNKVSDTEVTSSAVAFAPYQTVANSVASARIFSGRAEGCGVGIKEGSSDGRYIDVYFENNKVADVKYHATSIRPRLDGGQTASSAVTLYDISLATNPYIDSADIGHYDFQSSASVPRFQTGKQTIGRAGSTATILADVSAALGYGDDYALYLYDMLQLRNTVAIEAKNATSDNTVLILSVDGSNRLNIAGYDRKAGVYTRMYLGEHFSLNGTGLEYDGVKVLGTRGAALPADATDLATALTLVNAIKARMKATGGHGLVAD